MYNGRTVAAVSISALDGFPNCLTNTHVGCAKHIQPFQQSIKLNNQIATDFDVVRTHCILLRKVKYINEKQKLHDCMLCGLSFLRNTDFATKIFGLTCYAMFQNVFMYMPSHLHINWFVRTLRFDEKTNKSQNTSYM